MTAGSHALLLLSQLFETETCLRPF